MKKMVIIIVVALILTGIVCVVWNQNSQRRIPSSSSIETNKESDFKSITKEFEANIIDNKDHYTLSVLTNKIENDLTITYNTKLFALDNTSSLLQNANSSDDGNIRTIIISKDALTSNHLYEFNFVKLASDTMKFNKNVTIK